MLCRTRMVCEDAVFRGVRFEDCNRGARVHVVWSVRMSGYQDNCVEGENSDIWACIGINRVPKSYPKNM